MEILKFSYNWNNKLANRAFTSIRLSNPRKYQIGQTYLIQLKTDELGTAKLIQKRTLNINELGEFSCYLDTGYNKQETINIIKRMYPNVNWNNTHIDLCLFLYDHLKTTTTPSEAYTSPAK